MSNALDDARSEVDAGDTLRHCVSALAAAGEFGVPPAQVEIVETHISLVALAGKQVWKFKKPVNFGFLDFSTLDKRRRYCELELQLNQRFSPGYYLAVVAVVGGATSPRLVSADSAESALEYAVKMRRFAPGTEFDRLLRDGSLTKAHIDDLAQRVAGFHATAPATVRYGAPEQVVRPALDNFAALRPLLAADEAARQALDRLHNWTTAKASALHASFALRHACQFIRECHGDLHLGNIALDGGEIVIFDCIEFSDELRCIDVMSDVAFACVDLDAHDRGDLANLFLNRYLEETGDYLGVRVLRFYQVYRALVRAKVAALRSSQEAGATREARAVCSRYLEQALRYLDTTPQLIIMHGLSGSGKSRLSSALAGRLGAIRVRSDVERKRLHQIPANQRAGSDLASGVYSADATARTYAHLAELAKAVVQAGYSVIIDAAFLQRGQRAGFDHLATELGVAFRIVSLSVAEPELRRRLRQRNAHGADASDADETVLAHQLAHQEPLTWAEQAVNWVVEAGAATPERMADNLVGKWLKPTAGN